MDGLSATISEGLPGKPKLDRTVIVEIALAVLAEKNGYDPPPSRY